MTAIGVSGEREYVETSATVTARLGIVGVGIAVAVGNESG